MNFGELKERIGRDTGRTDISQLSYDLATSALSKTLRVRQMERIQILAQAYPAEWTVPADLAAPIEVALLDGSGEVVRYLKQQSEAADASIGDTEHYALRAGKLVATPAPDGASVRLLYYARLADLSADGDTNAALDHYPETYVYEALRQHASLRADMDGMAQWGGMADNAVMQANEDSNAAHDNATGMTVRFPAFYDN